MGASGWYYFVPFQENIEAALQTLRWQVFTSPEFHYLKTDLLKSMKQATPEIQKQQFIEEQAFRRFQELPEDSSVETWLARLEAECQTIEGTAKDDPGMGFHDILDITHIALTPEYYAITQLPLPIVQEQFGTIHPTSQDIRTKIADLWHSPYCERWHGMYIVAYDDTREIPHEIFFMGFSGD